MLSLQDMVGFNNTGNIRAFSPPRVALLYLIFPWAGVWVSEEVMAFYCLKHRAKFAGRRILEIGAGDFESGAYILLHLTELLQV
jgi:hypothetical protein